MFLQNIYLQSLPEIIIIIIIIMLFGGLFVNKILKDHEKSSKAMKSIRGTYMAAYLEGYRENKNKKCKEGRCDSFKKLDEHWQDVKAGKTDASPNEESTKWWDDVINEIKEKLKKDCPGCFKPSGSSSGGNSSENSSEEESE